jgi:hypothetical protein
MLLASLAHLCGQIETIANRFHGNQPEGDQLLLDLPGDLLEVVHDLALDRQRRWRDRWQLMLQLGNRIAEASCVIRSEVKFRPRRLLLPGSVVQLSLCRFPAPAGVLIVRVDRGRAPLAAQCLEEIVITRHTVDCRLWLREELASFINQSHVAPPVLWISLQVPSASRETARYPQALGLWQCRHVVLRRPALAGSQRRSCQRSVPVSPC